MTAVMAELVGGPLDGTHMTIDSDWLPVIRVPQLRGMQIITMESEPVAALVPYDTLEYRADLHLSVEEMKDLLGHIRLNYVKPQR